MESRSIPRPRSRRLQALARRSSRRASPRSILEVVGASLSLVRRVARLPFVPWKVFKTANVCLPVLPVKTSNKQQKHQGCLSLTQRKECLQPRKRTQRIKAKDRPSVASLQGATAVPAAAAAPSASSTSNKRGGDGRGPPGVSKRSSSKGGSVPHQTGTAAESCTEGSVVGLSPSSSFCCGVSVSSETHTGRTCSSSNGGRRRGKVNGARETSRGDSGTGSSSTAGGPLLVPSEGAPERYPAVHACRPRIFFITLSSIKRQAILDLSLAAARRGDPSSPCGDDHSTRTSSAKLETATASLSTTAATEKGAACPHVPALWPPPMLLPAGTAAAIATDERRGQEIETAATGRDIGKDI